jgi:hypothetical protein
MGDQPRIFGVVQNKPQLAKYAVTACIAFSAFTLTGATEAFAAEPSTDAGSASEPTAGSASEPTAGSASEPTAGSASEPTAGSASEPTAGSASEELEPSPPEGRELGGHVFMPVLGMVSPFTNTSFGTFMLLGYGSTTGSLTLQLPGNPPPPAQTFTGTVSYVAIGSVLSFEAAFLRYFAARIGLSETLYSGISGAAVAAVGSNARLGGNFGLTGSLPIGQSVRVAGVFDTSFAPAMGVLLGPAIKSAFDSCSEGVTNCRFDFGKLFEQRNVLSLEPGVAASWAPLPSLGVTGNLTYVHRSLTNSNSGATTSEAMSLGVAADFDFHLISIVPVGVQLSWNSRIPFDESVDGFSDLGAAVFYTGRKNLSLGLQFVDRRFRVVPDVDVSWTTFIALIGLRYYW